MSKKTKRKFYDIMCWSEDVIEECSGKLDVNCPGIPYTSWPQASYPFIRVFATEQEWLQIRFYLGIDKKPDAVYFY